MADTGLSQTARHRDQLQKALKMLVITRSEVINLFGRVSRRLEDCLFIGREHEMTFAWDEIRGTFCSALIDSQRNASDCALLLQEYDRKIERILRGSMTEQQKIVVIESLKQEADNGRKRAMNIRERFYTISVDIKDFPNRLLQIENGKYSQCRVMRELRRHCDSIYKAVQRFIEWVACSFLSYVPKYRFRLYPLEVDLISSIRPSCHPQPPSIWETIHGVRKDCNSLSENSLSHFERLWLIISLACGDLETLSGRIHRAQDDDELCREHIVDARNLAIVLIPKLQDYAESLTPHSR